MNPAGIQYDETHEPLDRDFMHYLSFSSVLTSRFFLSSCSYGEKELIIRISNGSHLNPAVKEMIIIDE